MKRLGGLMWWSAWASLLVGTCGPVVSNLFTLWLSDGSFGLEGALHGLLGVGAWTLGAVWSGLWAGLGLMLAAAADLMGERSGKWPLVANGLLLAVSAAYGVLALVVFGSP